MVTNKKKHETLAIVEETLKNFLFQADSFKNIIKQLKQALILGNAQLRSITVIP